MASNVTLPGAGVIVETLDQGGGVERQVVSAVQNGTWLVTQTGTWTVTQSGTWRATATEKWIAGSGQGLTWGSVFSTEVNSITNGQAILSSIAVANGTALDLFADISIALGSLTTGAGAPYIGFYLYPLNQDGSTYGDGRFSSAASGPPLSSYFVGQVPLIPSVTQAQTGTLTGVLMPPGSFKLVAYNQAGATLAASANTVAYRTYDRSVS